MRKIQITISLLFLLLMLGCAATIHTDGVVKFENYREVKRAAFLPAVHDNRAVVERMNKINYKVIEPALKAGYTIISVDEVENYLGKEFKELEKDPLNEKLIEKIATKYNLEAVVYCKINEWRQDELTRDRGGYYFDRVSLSYQMIDAKTFRTLSKISGNTEENITLNGDRSMDFLVMQLAAGLIGKL